jgi:O-antigen/teichoic acid export membrane protein
LAPEEFGLIALVMVFVGLSATLVDAGFSQALVQRKDVTDKDMSSVFYINILISLLATLGLYGIAPSVAQFYENDALILILRVLSFSVILGSLGAIQQSYLIRTLQFKKLFWVTFPATLFSGIAGVALAMHGYGVWALMFQYLANRMIWVLLLWLRSGWHPRLVFDFQCIREMFRYGSLLAISSLLDRGFQNAYVLVIGKFFTPVDVAFFQRARSLQQLPVSNLDAILRRVAFPLMSRIQSDSARMKRLIKQVIQMGAIFSFIGMALLAGVSEPLVRLLIGGKWLACVPYLQLFCIMGGFFPIHSINLTLLKALGRSDLFFRVELIKKVLIVSNIAVGVQFGVYAMVVGMVVVSLLSLSINLYYSGKFIEYGILEQLKDVGSSILVAAVLYLATSSCVHFTSLSDFSLLLVCFSLGIVALVANLRLRRSLYARDLQTRLKTMPALSRVAVVVLGVSV